MFITYNKQEEAPPAPGPDPKFSVWGYVRFISSTQFNLHFSWIFLAFCFEIWRLHCSPKPGKLHLFLSSPKIIIRKLCTVELLAQILSGAFAIAEERHLKHCLCVLSSVFEEMTSLFRAEDSHTSAIWDIYLIILKTLILCSYPETTVFNLTNKQGKIFSSWGDVYLFMLINENKVSSGSFHLKLTKNQLKVAGELKEFR